MNIELLDEETSINALGEYSATEAGLAELEGRLQGRAYDLTSVKGDAEARTDRKECVRLRTASDAVYEAWNKPMLATQKQMRERRDELKTRVLAVEKPIDEQIKADEARRAAEKAESEAAEKARVAVIHERISYLRDHVASASICLTSAQVEALAENLKAIEISEEKFSEFVAAAEVVKTDALKRLNEIIAAKQTEEAERDRVRVEQEQAAARLKEEREELERQRAEQAKIEAEARKERERHESEARAEREAEQRRMAEERAAFEAEQRAARQERDAELLRIAAERSELKAMQAPVILAPEVTAPVTATAVKQPVFDAIDEVTVPEAHELIQAVAETFNVPMGVAADWLVERADEINGFNREQS